MAEPRTNQHPTLIFIPDISGFTEFVHNTEFTHSQHIIKELLEVIIDANNLGLEISEIEGDAVLFYRFGRPPEPDDLLAQIAKMYVAFHAHLKQYANKRICQCGACISAHTLKLKFVVHFGQLGQNKVKRFSKLFGKDLIVAHRLLKNNINLDEYAIMTHDVLDQTTDWSQLSNSPWCVPKTTQETYDFGDIEFTYLPLDLLEQYVPEVEEFNINYRRYRDRLFLSTRDLKGSLQDVFDVVSDMSFRHEWQPLLKGSADLNSAIPQTGSTHRCVINGNARDPFQVAHRFDITTDRVAWVETDEEHKTNTEFTLEKIENNLTRMTLSASAGSNFAVRFILKTFLRKRLLRAQETAYDNLQAYLDELREEGRQHTSSVQLTPADVPAA